jgi:hypothetical protein
MVRIRLESEAKLYVQEMIRDGKLELAWSYILDYENSVNPFEERRTMIAGWKLHATTDVDETLKLLKKGQVVSEVRVVDPPTFIREVNP